MSIPDDGGVRKAPREIRSEYDRYREFFQVARDGLVKFSERLKDEVDEPGREKSLPSEDLAQALLHAQNGLNKTGEYRETLTGLFQDEAHQERAMAMLAELRGVQETVATILELFYDDIESAEDYTQLYITRRAPMDF